MRDLRFSLKAEELAKYSWLSKRTIKVFGMDTALG